MGFDLQGLNELMQTASEHLDHAVQTGDQEKAERMHGILNRANNLAEQQIQFHQAQAKGLPGLGSGTPTALIPQGSAGPSGALGAMGPPGINAQEMPPMAPTGRDGLPLKQQAPPQSPPAQAQPKLPPDEGSTGMPFDFGYNAARAVLTGGRPSDLLNAIPGVNLAKRVFGSGALGDVITGVTEDKPINETLSKAWGSFSALSPADQEKLFGSQENARQIQQRGNPEAAPAVAPTPSTPQTGLPPSEADMQRDGSYYAMPPANKPDGNKLYEEIYQRAIKGGNGDEAARIGRYRDILEKKPSFFTGDRLMSFLFQGAPKTMHDYQQEQAQWKGWMGKESELAQHYGQQNKALQMSKEGLNEERIKKMHLEEAKLAYDQLDKQHQRQLAPIMSELHSLDQNDLHMSSGNNALLIPNAKEQIAANAARRQQLLQLFNQHAGNVTRQLPK